MQIHSEVFAQRCQQTDKQRWLHILLGGGNYLFQNYENWIPAESLQTVLYTPRQLHITSIATRQLTTSANLHTSYRALSRQHKLPDFFQSTAAATYASRWQLTIRSCYNFRTTWIPLSAVQIHSVLLEQAWLIEVPTMTRKTNGKPDSTSSTTCTTSTSFRDQYVSLNFS